MPNDLLRYLTRAARFVGRKLALGVYIKVYLITNRIDPDDQLYGLFNPKNKKEAHIYVRTQNASGERYTNRFILSILAHELAHFYRANHNKKFRRIHQQITRIIRAHTKMFPMP